MLVLISDANAVNLDDYNIHVIASVLKQWLRDLPNPLMTFELYEEFLRATGMVTIFGLLIRHNHVFNVFLASLILLQIIVMLFGTGLQDKKEVVKSVYTVIDQLSRTHLSTLERLIFHLVR